MSGTNMEIVKGPNDSEVYQSEHRKWTGAAKLENLNVSPFPSVESVLGDIEECFDARQLIAERQS